jgi:hypothetical protein
MSLIGFAAAVARSAAICTDSAFAGFPSSAAPASVTKTGVGATDARATRTAWNLPSMTSTEAPTPATAMSISLRGMNRKYAAPE